jgi:hypothetical protein
VLQVIPVGTMHNLSVVMPGLVPGTHAFRATKQGVGGRDIRAFTPVFRRFSRRAGYAGHDALGDDA